MKQSVRTAVAALCFACLLLAAGCAGKTRPAKTPPEPSRHHPSWLGPPDLEVPINSAVRAEVARFTGPERAAFARALVRLSGVGMEMREILAAHGLPRDLVFVAVIESWLRTDAVSPSAAVGPWQFLEGTALEYGLRIDPWVDERREPIRATHAAAAYLSRAHATFGDWPLAIASYNAGIGGTARALQATGAKNFWRLAHSGKLREETQRYVPRVLAAALVGRYPDAYGFEVPAGYEFRFDVVNVEEPTPLAIAAALSGASEQELMDANPHLVRKITPPDDAPYPLLLPPGTGEILRAALAEGVIRPSAWYRTHTVERGDTMVSIARRHNVTAAGIALVNGGNAPRLHPGQAVYLPLPALSDVQRLAREGLFGENPPLEAEPIAAPPSPDMERTYGRSPEPGRPLHPRHGEIERGAAIHTVQAGESLWGVARLYDATVDEVRELNGIEGLVVQPGEKLLVPAFRAADPAQAIRFHEVVAGDSLESIAAAHEVTVLDLRRWNDLAEGDPVVIGDRLRIVVDRDEN